MSRLYLHVGLPKSGTTFLQGLMANNRTKLKDSGYIYPFIRRETMFHAAVELRGQHDRWGLEPERIDGTWEAVLERIRSFDGDGIVSHELLAAATPEQVSRVAADTADLELHVVVTARDLSRQATALWQEEVKNGRRWSFEEFSGSLFRADGTEADGSEADADPEAGVDPALGDSNFWRSQHLAAVLEHWSAVVPPERVHVVVVPRSSQDPLELWRRFAAAIGLDPDSLDLELQPRANESLGVAQVALLREVLGALDGRLGQPHYAHVVKRFFAQGQLSRVTSPAPVTPAALRDRLDEVARGWVEEIQAQGYAVHGSLDELLPGTVPPPETARHPDEVSAAEVLEGVPEVIAEMLVEIASLRGQLQGPKALPPLQLHPDPETPPTDESPSEQTPSTETTGQGASEPAPPEQAVASGRRRRWRPFRSPD